MHIVPSPNRPAPTATRSCLIAMLTSRVMIAAPKLAGYRPVLVRAKAQKGKGGLESRVTSHRPAPPLLSPSCRAPFDSCLALTERDVGNVGWRALRGTDLSRSSMPPARSSPASSLDSTGCGPAGSAAKWHPCNFR